MTNEEVWQYFFTLSNDAFDNENFPNNIPYVAHYTSLEVIEQILKNDQLWFSNPLFMNDYEELRFGIQQGANVFRNNQNVFTACKTRERHRMLVQHFESAFNDFNANEIFDYYVFCLTKHLDTDSDGLLSMWRGYGGKGHGVALVFDPSKLDYKIDNPAFIINEVKYLSTTDRFNWLNAKINQFAELLTNIELSDDQLLFPAYSLLHRLKLFALFTKHHGFKEEQEWRIVYHPDNDQEKKFYHMLDYHLSDKGLEPKFKFRVESMDGVLSSDFSFDKIIKEIILGPTMSSPLAKKSFERMLEKIGKTSLIGRVCPSTTPYRT